MYCFANGTHRGKIKCHTKNGHLFKKKKRQNKNIELWLGYLGIRNLFFFYLNDNFMSIQVLIIHCRNPITCMPKKYPVFLTVINILDKEGN